jgi:hypothetical protein
MGAEPHARSLLQGFVKLMGVIFALGVLGVHVSSTDVMTGETHQQLLLHHAHDPGCQCPQKPRAAAAALVLKALCDRMLEEKVHLHHLVGAEHLDGGGCRVLRLRRPWYGQRHALWAWNQQLEAELAGRGLCSRMSIPHFFILGIEIHCYREGRIISLLLKGKVLARAVTKRAKSQISSEARAEAELEASASDFLLEACVFGKSGPAELCSTALLCL